MKSYFVWLAKSVLTVFVLVLVTASALGFVCNRQSALAEESTENAPNRYVGITGTRTIVTETVNFSSYTVTDYNPNYDCPQLFNINPNITNCCGAVGGADIVAFYDRYCIDLIPNCAPGHSSNGRYYYYVMGVNQSANQAVIDSLYVSMGTNIECDGVTRDQFQAGLYFYAFDKGYTTTFTSVMNSNGTLNNSSIMSQMANGRVVALYLNNLNTSLVSFGTNSATYTIQTYTGLHICVAYRYKLIRYYNANNVNFRTDILLGISTGYFSFDPVEWYYVGYSGTTLDYADAVNIY